MSRDFYSEDDNEFLDSDPAPYRPTADPYSSSGNDYRPEGNEFPSADKNYNPGSYADHAPTHHPMPPQEEEEEDDGDYYEEDTRNDYFDGPAIPEPQPKKQPKKPALKPEDPRYWDQDESEFEHLKPRPVRRGWLWIALAAVVIGFLIGAYVRCCVPYVDSATQYGYVDSIEKRGSLFKTFEGVILPYKNLMDSTRPYEHDFIFSTVNTDAAVALRRAQFAHRPVRVEYKVYRSAMPWRGDSRIVITAVDTVNPRHILPPDRNPEFLKK